jgi:anti-sigma regulatory factor (Ser/Thr protein kinase)
MSLESSHQFPYGPSAPAAARAAVDDVFAGELEPAGIAELRLLVSELVTNAVRHGGTRRGGVGMSLRLVGRCLRVEVFDGGDGFEPPVRESDPHAPGGWGLVVVEELVDRWGVDVAGGTRVWFERNV